MGNGKAVETFSAPVARNDFQKSNGTVSSDHMIYPGGPSMTRQEFADECDVNTIMAKYDAYLSDPARSIREPVYYDFTAMPDSLMGAMEVLHRGEAAFYSLPATVRKEFENNPAMFVDFASDPENLPQMRTWGLAPPEAEAPVPMAVRIVPDAPAGGADAPPDAPASPGAGPK